MIEQECFGIVFGIQKNRHILVGSFFTEKKCVPSAEDKETPPKDKREIPKQKEVSEDQSVSTKDDGDKLERLKITHKTLGHAGPGLVTTALKNRNLSRKGIKKDAEEVVKKCDREISLLREVSEDKVAAYVTKYKATLRRLAEDETLGDKALTEPFLKGIKPPRFRLRMKAALEGGYKDMSGLTKLIFQQVQLVLETLEDAKRYLEEPRALDALTRVSEPKDQLIRTSAKTIVRDVYLVCWKCGKKGHFASECTASTNTTSKDRKEVTCVNYKKVGQECFPDPKSCSGWRIMSSFA
ncbi:hypothetical protein ADUPG1_013167 [Aduncisulcus paluster]|uniref:CCHC-type domain-containing protein n=1 Tax=Aduncisulcus paluster TaxID=2918883 RepID=A0ABQ5K587_9EUKA|nr:hypothetical protein ADUPG1_013167 [Aduncisulcus paluster]